MRKKQRAERVRWTTYYADRYGYRVYFRGQTVEQETGFDSYAEARNAGRIACQATQQIIDAHGDDAHMGVDGRLQATHSGQCPLCPKDVDWPPDPDLQIRMPVSLVGQPQTKGVVQRINNLNGIRTYIVQWDGQPREDRHRYAGWELALAS